MVTFKSTVRLAALTPVLMRIFQALIILDDEMAGDIVVTSINDSQHMSGSQHYRNTALDIRTNDRPKYADQLMVARLRQILGPHFTVLYESEGTVNEHIHVQLKRGLDPDVLIGPGPDRD